MCVKLNFLDVVDQPFKADIEKEMWVDLILSLILKEKFSLKIN